MTQAEEILKRVVELEKQLHIHNLLQKELLSLDEAVLLTGVSKSCIYKWISTRKLPHFKPSGKLVFVKREDLYEFITRSRYSSKLELVMSGASQIADKSKTKQNGTNC
jgi:excisionase family DNA binding protein